jgi:hypothetical protein
MDINRINSKILEEETTLGIYVWQMPDGRLETMMAIFFQSRPKKEIDPRSMLWLEKFAHSAYMKAGLNFFLEEERLTMKNSNTKSKD